MSVFYIPLSGKKRNWIMWFLFKSQPARHPLNFDKNNPKTLAPIQLSSKKNRRPTCVRSIFETRAQFSNFRSRSCDVQRQRDDNKAMARYRRFFGQTTAVVMRMRRIAWYAATGCRAARERRDADDAAANGTA